jgi:putative addiction module component (TIGR02574 family)
MSSDALKLLEDALRLPENDRADLAARLLESLDPEGDEGAEDAWAAEVERRIHEMDSGKVQPIPWSEARRIIGGETDASPRN